jgi:hypothetical protein
MAVEPRAADDVSFIRQRMKEIEEEKKRVNPETEVVAEKTPEQPSHVYKDEFFC